MRVLVWQILQTCPLWLKRRSCLHIISGTANHVPKSHPALEMQLRRIENVIDVLGQDCHTQKISKKYTAYTVIRSRFCKAESEARDTTLYWNQPPVPNNPNKYTAIRKKCKQGCPLARADVIRLNLALFQSVKPFAQAQRKPSISPETSKRQGRQCKQSSHC